MRHPSNNNLVLSSESTWQGLAILDHRGAVVINYLERIRQVINKALDTHSRTLAVRCDLTFPVYGVEPDTAVISRFVSSFKAQLKADEQRKAKAGRRVHFSDVNYVWVKERHDSEHWHYHVCFFVNKDAYFNLGVIRPMTGSNNADSDMPMLANVEPIAAQNMADRVRVAWASALGMNKADTGGLVHFPENATYHLDTNSPDFDNVYQSLFRRLSYFAKSDTKHYGDGTNCFGCSRT